VSNDSHKMLSQIFHFLYWPSIQCMKVHHFSIFLFLLCVFSFTDSKSQNNSLKQGETNASVGYLSKGDSIQFIFGQQQQVIIGGLKVSLEKRIKEINQVNIAGDFNDWNPDNPQYQMIKMYGTVFKLTICKKFIGEKGEVRQFKYVLNHTYWVEPPLEAINKFTGKDGNTNLTLKLN
jgi:hypothetical protein